MTNDELRTLIEQIETYQEANIHAPWVDDDLAIARDLGRTLTDVVRALAVMDAQALLYDAEEMANTDMTIEELFLFTYTESPLHGKVEA